MLKLIQAEFMKLRRRKFIWLMLLASLLMPALGMVYYSGREVDSMQFYKWAAFSYTQWIILPAILGMFCTMLIHIETQGDMLKQLWVVPVSKMRYFFSKFILVIFYSLMFMLITALASVLSGAFLGSKFDGGNIVFLFVKCLEIGVLSAAAILPVLSVASAQKGYILPICVTLLYSFLGFIMLMVNMYLIPLSSASAIIMRNVPGAVLNQTLNIPFAFLCIVLWGIASVVFANIALKKKAGGGNE